MTARLISAAKTDVGLKRTHNEDNFIMIPSAGLWVLCDGMGGHASGQVASSLCVTNVAQFICDVCRKPGFTFPYQPNPQLSYEANLLSNAIKYANERVFIESCKDRAKEGMGTTITAILSTPNSFVLAHVGDSRIYRMRNRQITQVSRDHSLLNHLIDKGELKPEDAKNFANKNVILRAIGLKDYVDVEVKEVPRMAGDVYLMCSDGLSDLVSSELICNTVYASPTLNDACNQLIGHALQAGGKDNVTVLTVAVEQSDDDPNFVPVPLAKQNKPSAQVAQQPQAAKQPVHSSSPSNMRSMAGGVNPSSPANVAMNMQRIQSAPQIQNYTQQNFANNAQDLTFDPNKRMHSVREVKKEEPIPEPVEEFLAPPPVVARKRMAVAMPAPPQAFDFPVPEEPKPVALDKALDTSLTSALSVASPVALLDDELGPKTQPELMRVELVPPEAPLPLPDTSLLLMTPPAAVDDSLGEVNGPKTSIDNMIPVELLAQSFSGAQISPASAPAVNPQVMPAAPPQPPRPPSFVPQAAAAAAIGQALQNTSAPPAFLQVQIASAPAAPPVMPPMAAPAPAQPMTPTPVAEPPKNKGYSMPNLVVKPQYKPELERDFFDDDDEDSIEISG